MFNKPAFLLFLSNQPTNKSINCALAFKIGLYKRLLIIYLTAFFFLIHIGLIINICQNSNLSYYCSCYQSFWLMIIVGETKGRWWRLHIKN